MSQCEITEINIYPVKSLAGISCASAMVTEKGFQYDRHWMLINPKGQFVTQRQMPQLALIKTQLESDSLRLSHVESGKELSIAFQISADAERREARVWQNQCQVLDEGDVVADWLTTVTQSPFPLRLVRMAEDFERNVDQSDKLGSNAVVKTDFADGFPYLITNEESLNKLNQHLSLPIPMNRFRPNIVVSGLEAFSEHKIKALNNSQVEFALQYPCERCIVTTIDQTTAVKHPEQEPLKTLRRLNPMPNTLNAAAFGENASLGRGEGKIISVGDRLAVE